MIHLIYICASSGTPSEKDLIELLEQSRSKNKALNITGMLLFNQDTYMQVLEGEKDHVHQLFNSIKLDSRAERIIPLVDQEIQQRAFPGWSMGFKNLTSQKPAELAGFSEIFDGKVDPQIAAKKSELAVDLILSFAEKSEDLRPVSSA